MKAWADPLYGNSGWSRIIKNTDLYFRPGLTFPRRTKRFCPKALPTGVIFGHGGQTILSDRDVDVILGIIGSSVAQELVTPFLGTSPSDQGGTNPQFETGIIQRIPLPEPEADERTRTSYQVIDYITIKRDLDTADETSHAFTLPALLQVERTAIAEGIAAWQARIAQSQADLSRHQRAIDETAFRLYGISEEDRFAIERDLTSGPSPAGRGELEVGVGSGVPADNEENEAGTAVSIANGRALVADLVSYLLGCVFGRCDVRLALDHSLAPKLQGPFDPLPVCSPGMLIGQDGLPAGPGNIVSEEWLRARPDAITSPPVGSIGRPMISDAEYPLTVAWDGILVDDPEHPSDVVRRVREVLALLWQGANGAEADAVEQEACDILGVRELREYFRRPAGFFAEHLKRYSKSRRQAPIYWPLSTASGSFTLWLYCHRLTSDTLFTAVNRYVEPKIGEVERQAREMTTRLADARGREATVLRAQLEQAVGFLTELTDFRTELLRVAALPYLPNLDDGVIINAAPLHTLFRLPRWAKDTRECWEKLQRGDYDWAHLAYTLWPERVETKCRTDRSLAIAHRREDLYQESPTSAPARRRSRGGTAPDDA